jgi:hypothetical protein
VRIEGGDQRRPPFGAGALDRAADHRLVPEVKSIEIAERDDAPAKRSGTAEPPSSRSMARAIGEGGGADNRRLAAEAGRAAVAHQPDEAEGGASSGEAVGGAAVLSRETSASAPDRRRA